MIKRYSTTDLIYKLYKEKKGKQPYKTYMAVLSDFNLYVFDKMIEDGRVLVLPERMGKMFCATIWRNFNRKIVDWKLTKEYRARGEKTMIYYTDPFSVKIMWYKGKTPNRLYYKFKPTKGCKGNIPKLIEANRQDPLLYKKYSQKNHKS
jgi:hypothetical protein